MIEFLENIKKKDPAATNYLEIAINRGNAASLFGFSLHNEKSLFYNHVKIFFL